MIERIVAGARRPPGELITYSDLVRGIVFVIPNVNDGKPIELGRPEWSGLHRKILGEALGVLSARTFLEQGFMVSALVVNKNEFAPSSEFFEWVKWLEILPDLQEDTVLAFWADHVRRAHDYYQRAITRPE